MWRKRCMLGLAEKNILNFDVDVVASDPSDANTNTATLFSDDPDERSQKSANLDVCMSAPQEADFMASASLTATPAISPGASHMELQQTTDYWPKDPVTSDRQTVSTARSNPNNTPMASSTRSFCSHRSEVGESWQKGGCTKQVQAEKKGDKKIKYVNRKKLAERRRRVGGQFVRKMNGVNVDLNGLPTAEFDVEEEEE